MNGAKRTYRKPTDAQISDMYLWAMGNGVLQDAEGATDEQIAEAVEAEYPGGVGQFKRDYR